MKEPTRSMKSIYLPLGFAVISSLLLAACETATMPQSQSETTLISTPGEGPPDARPGACYGKDVTPATIEVVTEQTLITPARIAPDGAIISPAVYDTLTHQAIIESRKEFFFEVPCPEMMTTDFITSLQRALKARGLYRGRLSGVMDERTKRAIRKFQIPAGLNSSILTMDTARQLGLAAYGRDGF